MDDVSRQANVSGGSDDGDISKVAEQVKRYRINNVETNVEGDNMDTKAEC